MSGEEQARCVLHRWQSLASEGVTSVRVRGVGPQRLWPALTHTSLPWLASGLLWAEESRPLTLHLRAKVLVLQDQDEEQRIPYAQLGRVVVVEEGLALEIRHKKEDKDNFLWLLSPSSAQVAEELVEELRERMTQDEEDSEATAFEVLFLGWREGDLGGWDAASLETAAVGAEGPGVPALILLRPSGLGVMETASGGRVLWNCPSADLLALCQVAHRMVLVFSSCHSLERTTALFLQASDEAAMEGVRRALVGSGEPLDVHHCERCPLRHFTSLASRLRGLDSPQSHQLILQSVADLPPRLQESIIARYSRISSQPRPATEQRTGTETPLGDYHRRNLILMGVIHQVCFTAQSQHEKALKGCGAEDEGPEAKTPLGRTRSRSLGGENLQKIIDFSRRSLANSLDNLGKQLVKGEEMAETILNNAGLGGSEERVDGEGRPRSATISQPRRSTARTSLGQVFAQRRLSWRQALFSRVVSPLSHSARPLPLLFQSEGRSEAAIPEEGRAMVSDYRGLWRKAITEHILNQRLLQRQKVQSKVEDRRWSRLKLDYEEMPSSPGKNSEALWTRILPASSSSSPPSSSEVADAVRAGVPRHLRGCVWTLLSRLHAQSPCDPPVPPYSYPELLKGLTPHQHAILVDLGRTFPAHAYFQRQLGPGQVALYNLLKAYSLLDVEVGYCQGLSFVAGVLLLHMEEAEAFDALVTLMFRFRLRRHYLPDMSALQTEMYQFSRLLHDRAPLVHAHLERHEIPLLYAAPWFLTLFASTFPLGFVARVFDFLFLRGSTELVFAVGLRLMSEHAELIRHCDSFEAINDFLKTTLPPMSIIQMERIFNGVWETRVGTELAAFEVEYSLLEEEAAVGSAGAESAGGGSGDTSEADDESQDDGSAAELRVLNSSLQRHNQQLEQQLAELQAQLAEANETIGDLRSQLASLQTNPRLNGIVRDKKH